jgi:hypothetical protein
MLNTEVNVLVPRLMYLRSWVTKSEHRAEILDLSAHVPTTKRFQVLLAPGVRALEHHLCTL